MNIEQTLKLLSINYEELHNIVALQIDILNNILDKIDYEEFENIYNQFDHNYNLILNEIDSLRELTKSLQEMEETINEYNTIKTEN